MDPTQLNQAHGWTRHMYICELTNLGYHASHNFYGVYKPVYTVADFGDCRRFLAVFGDSRRFLRQSPFSVTVWTGLKHLHLRRFCG